MPTTVGAVRAHLGLTPARPVDDLALANAVAAANDLVAALRPDLSSPAAIEEEDGDPWPARADYAATLQAARLYGRRGSVQGVAAFAEVGVSLLPRLDPDVRLLLQLGEYQDSVTA
jgi:hypothetical protein